MNTDLSPRNELELWIYRFLGVGQFRKAILCLEKIKHRGDSRKNENYHPSGLDVPALERYQGFLLYNACLHVVSLLLTAAYVGITAAWGLRWVVMDTFMVLLTLMNVYCILLQRFSSLRIRKLCGNYYRRLRSRRDLCSEEALQKLYAREPQKLLEDYGVLTRIRSAFEGREDCVLGSGDCESLRRIAACVQPVPQKGRGQTREVPMTALYSTGPYTVLQRRADRLQRRLKAPGRKILDRSVILTETAECEQLYRALFPGDSVSSFCLVCCLVHEVYAEMLDKGNVHEG